LAEFGLKSLSSTQVSRAAKLLDTELDAWRTRPLGEFRHLFIDARYEKEREGGVVRDVAIFAAIGVDADGARRVLGVSADPSEAEIHWRTFLDSLVARGLRGVATITSDDHAGLGAARKAVFPGALWQRCQFHLAQSAIHHAPNNAIRKRIGAELRRVWNAANLQAAEEELKEAELRSRQGAFSQSDRRLRDILNDRIGTKGAMAEASRSASRAGAGHPRPAPEGDHGLAWPGSRADSRNQAGSLPRPGRTHRTRPEGRIAGTSLASHGC
jgi:transposase-like protein